MEDNRLKTMLGVFFVVVLLIGITVGAILTKNLTETKTTKTSASVASVSPIEIVSPKPGSKINSTDVFKGLFATDEKLTNLQAVLKIDDIPAKPLKISQAASGKISLDGVIPTAELQPGRHNIAVYLYNTSSGQPVLVGSAVFSIQI